MSTVPIRRLSLVLVLVAGLTVACGGSVPDRSSAGSAPSAAPIAAAYAILG